MVAPSGQRAQRAVPLRSAFGGRRCTLRMLLSLAPQGRSETRPYRAMRQGTTFELRRGVPGLLRGRLVRLKPELLGAGCQLWLRCAGPPFQREECGCKHDPCDDLREAQATEDERAVAAKSFDEKPAGGCQCHP